MAPRTRPGRAAFVTCALLALAFAQDEGCVTPAGRPGACVRLRACEPLFSQLTSAPRPVPATLTTLLQRSHCGFQGRDPKVCCPPAGSPATAPPVAATAAYSEPPPDVSAHPNLALLPPNCGPTDDSKLLGGNKTGVYEFPWMALLAYNARRGISFKCGGTIINSRYILTAAHCITALTGGQTLLGVRVGEHDTSTDQDCEGAEDDRVCAPPVQDFTVEEVVPHPYYTPERLQDDIGLIRLSAPINFTYDNVQAICLPTSQELARQSLDGRRLVVAGWGATESGLASPDLLKVNLPIISNLRCGEVHNRSVASGVGFRQVCAGGLDGVDSCGGDSGGPLKLPGQVGATVRYVQHGIVSFGPRRCGSPGLPGVYTRVAYYMDWLLNNLKP